MNSHIKHIRIHIAILALVGYLFAAVFGLFYMTRMTDMQMSMGDCPYVIGSESVCTMNVFDHISAWQAFSNVVIPPLVLLIIAVGIVFILLQTPSVSLIKIRSYTRRQRECTVDWQQELFSNGILNSKAP